MEKDTAHDLASFINERGSRFSAGVLLFGDRGWVVVKDTQTERHLEPIADPQDYLRRANTGALKIDDACRDLIHEWVRED
ncbi:MAG: hypothetical protein V4671_19005 [Armatimonadota bacterium]